MNATLGVLLSKLYDGSLAPEHRADLGKSGLTDATIHAQSIRSVPPSMIPQLLGFDAPKVVGAYVIPFADPRGGYMDHTRLKVFPSYHDARGRVVKYLGPRGAPPRLFFPVATMAATAQAGAAVWLLEGAKKACAAAQLGFPAVGFEVGFDDAVAAGATREELGALPTIEAWPRMADEAFYGLAGDLVRVISPYSEGDPVAALLHLLAAVGNLLGPGPHARVQHDRHPARLFVALVGPTSKGRKGLSWSAPRYVLGRLDAEWTAHRIASGLSSGEGLIWHVRDERIERQPVRERGRVIDYQPVVVDHGEPDKRLLVIEPELASVFKRMAGESNSLSAVLRNAWDDVPLATLTKNSPLRATGAHVSLIGHVTAEELRLHLTEVERANGFGNRWMYALVRRAQVLPDGEPVPEALLDPVIAQFRAALDAAQPLGQLRRDPEAGALWRSIYPALSQGEPGLVGAILGRGEAQVLRVSLIYALLDRAPEIRAPHLAAALAIWDYCTTSARRIFAGRLGFTIADTLLEVLHTRGSLTTTELHGVFGRHQTKDTIQTALAQLVDAGKVRSATQETAGRSATTWKFVS